MNLKETPFLSLFLYFFYPCWDNWFPLVFTETKTNAFGKKLRKQVKERLDYYEKRLASRRKKIDAKNAAIDSIMNKGMPRD